MLYNYRLLGTWPLAVTAYNHGPGGLRRPKTNWAPATSPSSSSATRARRSASPRVIFMSRSWRPWEVDRNAEKFFGPLTRLPDTDSTPTELPDYIPVDALSKSLQGRYGALRVLNPGAAPAHLERREISCARPSAAIAGTPPPAEITADGAACRRRSGYGARTTVLSSPPFQMGGAQRRIQDTQCTHIDLEGFGECVDGNVVGQLRRGTVRIGRRVSGPKNFSALRSTSRPPGTRHKNYASEAERLALVALDDDAMSLVPNSSWAAANRPGLVVRL